MRDGVASRRPRARDAPCDGPPVGRVGRGGHAGADAASARRGAARARVAPVPAEPLGALAQARDEVAAGERQPALGIDARARCGSRSSIGSMPSAIASSSIADSSANMPGHSPGARIQDGVGTSSAASAVAWCGRFGAAYIIRVAHGGLLGELLDRRGLLDRRRARSPSAGRRRRRRGARAGSSACGSR